MIVVKLEQGWERERAASFAWTSTAFPMLTGTLVTAAGFMPIGLANSAVGEYTGGIFWVVGIALVASWFVAVLFTPYLGFRLLPTMPKRPSAERKRDLRDAVLPSLPQGRSNSVCRARSSSSPSRRAARPGAEPVQQGPTAVLSAVRAARILLRAEARRRLLDPGDRSRGQGGRAPCRGDADAHSYTSISARARRGSGSGSSRSSRTILRPDRDRRARRRGARADQGAHRGRGRQGRAERGAGAARPVQFRPAGRLSGSVSHRRPAADVVREAAGACATSCAPIRGSSTRISTGARKCLRCGSRSTKRAPGARPDAAGYRSDAADAGRRGDRHDAQGRRERVDVVARATPSERAALDRIEDLTIASRDGAPVPVGQVARVIRTTEEPSSGERIVKLSSPRSPTSSTASSRRTSRGRCGRSSPRSANRCRRARASKWAGRSKSLQKGNSSIFVLFPVMILAMLTLLMIQMQSFSRLAMVFFTAPLGIVGASIALNLSGGRSASWRCSGSSRSPAWTCATP